MRYIRTGIVALSGAILLSAAGLAPVLAQSSKGGSDPVPFTLNLLVWDFPGRQSEAVANDLVRIAGEVSEGTVTIVPTFVVPTFGVEDAATAATDGAVDLALIPAREWDALGVTSMDALEAPFLIDDDALALAVASSDIADRAMAGLDALGVTGLIMWPEDLRHLFAFGPSGKVFRTPADIAGSTILVVAGKPGHDLITTLGGTIYEEEVATGELSGYRDTDASSGTLAGMVAGLWGAGLPITDVTVAGDVPVYAKYQTLVANSAMLERLTPDQRSLLDEIVAKTHEAALGHHFTQADLAAALCERGGRVIEAGPEAIAELRAAAAPLTEALASDPVTAGLMADIETLKTATDPAPGAGTCEPATEGTSATPGQMSDVADEGFMGDQPVPNGVYRIEVSADDLLSAGAARSYVGPNQGTWTWTFEDGTWSASHMPAAEQCQGGVTVAGDHVELSDEPGGGCSMGYDLQWRLEGDGIRFRVLDLNWMTATPDALAGERALSERIWTRIDE